MQLTELRQSGVNDNVQALKRHRDYSNHGLPDRESDQCVSRVFLYKGH